ncbi:hypothetical protein [Anatilimnocola aggregata]|nr:hypothetical protein [Anatilimnocola aggregata]
MLGAVMVGLRVASAQEAAQPANADSAALQTAGKPLGTKFLEESIDGAPLVGLEVGIFGPQSLKPEAGIYSVRPI